jgi:hypothetical protein
MTARRDDGLVLLLILIGLLILMLCVARTAHAQVTIADQIIARQKVVVGTTTASSSPLTVVGLPGSGDILRVGAGGSVGTGPLVIADIPSDFTRRSVNEAISGFWTFGSGSLSFTHGTSNFLIWPATGVAYPTVLPRSLGTRAVLWPGVNTTVFDFAIGIGSNTLWASVPEAGTQRFAWFASDGDINSEPADQDLVAELTGLRDFLPGQGYSGRLGLLTRKWLSLSAAELQVETLVAQDTIATIGGRVLVGPTTQLTTDIPAASAAINVKHNNLVSGDVIYLEANGQVEFMRITSSAGAGSPFGAYAYTVTRNLDGSGANDWPGGAAAFNTGQTGAGFIDLYALRGTKAGTELGPTIVGNVRTSSAYNAWAPRWAIGNLQGIYGYTGATYGSAFGDPSSTFVAVDATNGFRVINSGTTIGQWNTAGVVTIGGLTTAQPSQIHIDSDSLDMQFLLPSGASGCPPTCLKTTFSIYNSGSSDIAVFYAPTNTMSGLTTPSVQWLSGDLSISTSLNLSNIVLTAGPGPAGGRILPGNDAVTPLGSGTKRWNNIHVVLPVQTANVASSAVPFSGFPYLVTGDRGDATLSRLGYYCGSTTYNFPVQANSACTSGYALMSWQCGVMTSLVCQP